MTTLVITGALVLFLNTGLVGATPLGESATPLFDGFTVRLRRGHERGAARSRRH